MHTPRKGLHVEHKDLKKGMQILTEQGWRTVKKPPQSYLGGSLIVRFTNDKHVIQDPHYVWVRRINSPLPTTKK